MTGTTESQAGLTSREATCCVPPQKHAGLGVKSSGTHGGHGSVVPCCAKAFKIPCVGPCADLEGSGCFLTPVCSMCDARSDLCGLLPAEAWREYICETVRQWLENSGQMNNESNAIGCDLKQG